MEGDLFDQSATSINECKNICIAHNECNAITISISANHCWFKHLNNAYLNLIPGNLMNHNDRDTFVVSGMYRVFFHYHKNV